MKTLLFCTLILCSLATKATNYYFSNVSGDDSRTSANAQSPSTPWKTLKKLNSYFNNFNPGDSILLRRGETFYGSIIFDNSGTKNAPIIIGAYGAGNDPVITGLVSLTWFSAGNNLWRSNEALGLDALNMVTVNGVPAGMGRWPNLNNGNGGYDSIRSFTSKTITDKEGLTNNPSAGKPKYFVGAEIVVRTQRWLLDRHPITDYNGGNSTITFDPSSTNEVHSNNFGYFIQDDSTVLDVQDEWWYDRDNKNVKMYSEETPANVSAANMENLLISSGKSNVTVDNITFNGCNSDAMNISGGSNVIIQNCTIKNIGRNAVNTTTPYCSFLNNTMVDIMSKGVLINAEADHTILRYNTIRNISEIAGLGTSQQEDDKSSFTGDGVYIKADAAIVEFNRFINIGYSAVHLTKVDSVIINSNFIDTVCNVMDDGGGIYSYTGDPYTNKGRKITNNIILHGIGAFYGSGVNSATEEGAGVAGIYNDRNSSDNEIDGNTVAYFEKGIFMNFGCNRLDITDNTLFSNSKSIQINTRLKDGDKTRNLTINNNIALAATASQKAMYIYSDDGDALNNFGAIDANYYARPIKDNITMSWQTDQGSKNLYDGSLASWQNKYPGYDANSKKSPQATTHASQLWFRYNATSDDVTISLDANYIDVKGKPYSNSVVLKPFTSLVLINTNDSTQNLAPTVAITSPSVKASFSAPASINISANASDSDGSIATVEFYSGDSLINTQTTSPYSFTWSNVAVGNYVLTARATDDDGSVTSSDSVNISVKNINTAPAISITSPSATASFTAPASINIIASASDTDGSIAKVEFYNGNTLLNTQTTSPYSFTWDNVARGNYLITAKATDNDGLVTSDSVNVSVTNVNGAPAVAITSPSADSSFSTPATIKITAAASDSDGSVIKVDFYNGNTLLGTAGTSPYTFSWNNVAPGNYTLTAKATDNDSLVTSSDSVKITVANSAPIVSITTPSNKTKFTAPASINLSATASDADGSIVKVDFYSGDTLLATQTTSPYSFTWNNVKAGNYVLMAKATDNGGLVSSDSVTISVTNPNGAPTVSITSPAANANFTAHASVNISANASDADGSVAKVDFYNGNTLLATQTTSPYSFTWKNVATGNYVITAKATDNNGLVASDSVTISVTSNKAPGVTITNPLANETYSVPASIDINATATDADGSVVKVDFYAGNTLLGTQNASPYTFTWNNVAAGKYVLIAKATDDGGLVTSDSVNIVVTNINGAPAVSITSPSNNATFKEPAYITINAAASDTDGVVAKVDFYRDGTLLGTDSISPYTFAWKDVAAGTYVLTAKATDDGGLVTLSDSVNITVTKNGAPTVSITSPSPNAGFIAPASIEIVASAADADGSITRVDFYNGNTLIGTDTTSPYSFLWKNVAQANYSLTARATDNKGLVTSSPAITVYVIKPNVAPVVAITTPVTNTEFAAAASISISADASDVDGSIAKVEFFIGNILLETEINAPYIFTWKNIPAGDYILTAKATDNNGRVTISAPVAISTIKSNVPPRVSITSPKANAGFSIPASINIYAAASDTDGFVTKVDFYNGNTLMGTDTTSPYSFTCKIATAGSYVLTAKATDNNGLVTSSVAVTVVIKPNVAPTVSITSPKVKAQFNAPASVTISAAAVDIDGSISKVEFYIGSALLETESRFPYSFTWKDVPAGSYILTAKAIDNKGLAAISVPVLFSVIKPKIAPKVSINSPHNTAGFTAPASIKITAAASDEDGYVTKVDFYNGNTYLGSDKTSPYSFTWKNVAKGSYSLIAKATDNNGLVTVSTAVKVVVTASKISETSHDAGNDHALLEDGGQHIYEDNLNGVKIRIGPNPASSMLTLFTNDLIRNKKVYLSILSMSGSVIKTITYDSGSQDIQVNTSILTAGFYVLKVTAEDAVFYKQFEKQ